MIVRKIVPRERARHDVDAALDHYLRTVDAETALRFVDRVEEAYHAIAEHPATGSPRFAHELDLPGLRSWRVKTFPYLIFYIAREDTIDIWRILHVRRDIPPELHAPDDA